MAAEDVEIIDCPEFQIVGAKDTLHRNLAEITADGNVTFYWDTIRAVIEATDGPFDSESAAYARFFHAAYLQGLADAGNKPSVAP